MMPRQLGPTTRIGLSLQDVADLLLEVSARFAPVSEKPAETTIAPCTPAGHALREHVGHGRRRRGDHREVDLGRDVADARVRLESEDRLVLGVDRVDRRARPSHRVVHDRPADRAFGLRRADNGDGLWVEHPLHEVNTSYAKVPK